MFQVANIYIFKTMLPANSHIQLLLTLILIAPLNMQCALAACQLPKDQHIYLDNVALAQKASS